MSELMTHDQIEELCKKYFDQEGYTFPTHFEHRLEERSSRILYSLIRHFKPTSALGMGTWHGGSTCVMMAAFLKNGNKFKYVASELLDELRASTERNCIEKNGVAPAMIGDITKNLDKVPKTLDFIYHDTDHDLETTKWIHENIFPRIKKGSLVAMHDWAVEFNEEGKLWGKGGGGTGGWPETQYWMDEYEKGTLGLKPYFWTWKKTNYGLNGGEETAFWIKE